MKLDLDLIKKVLLFIEEHAILDSDLHFNELCLNDFLNSDDFFKADKEQIAYTLICLKEAGFIESYELRADGPIVIDILVERLTYAGHEFLEKIKPDTIWNKTKKILGLIGCKSLDVAVQVASITLTNFIKIQMGLP